MPYPDPMNLELTPAELDQALSDITKVIDLLNGKKQINLSKAERQGANAIDNERRPYVLKTFDKLAIDYPALRPGYIDFAIAQKDYAYTSDTELILQKLATALEIASDHNLSAGRLAYKYMRKFYDNAKGAEDTNTPGVDVVLDELSPLFEGQGNSNTPPAP